MKGIKFSLLPIFLMLVGCSTTDQFRAFAKNAECGVYSYAVLAHPINANGSIDDSVASVQCDNSLAIAEGRVLNGCESKYGRKCLISMTYTRSSDSFEYLQPQNIADARQRQAEQYYESLKNQCNLIGYAKGTTQNSDCVMKLVQQAQQAQQQQSAIQVQQNAINRQQQDAAFWQMLQSIQMMNQPVAAPLQTTCNRVGQYVNCTTR